MLTIRDAFETLYVPHRPTLSQRTIQRYRDEITRWERHTSNPPIDQIVTATFNQFRADCLRTGLKATTIEAGIRTVLQVLRLCGPEQERREGLGLIPKVPYVGRPLRQHGTFRPTPTVDELRLCYRFCGGLHWPPNVSTETFWRAWLGVGFVTGLRLSDMLALRPSDLRGDTLFVTARKTGTNQVFALPPWVLAEVAKLPMGEWFFPCRRLPCFVRRELHTLSDRLGLQPLTPQGIRRASITSWAMVHDGCSKLIHGEGLRIRDHYVDRLALLRRFVNELPRLSAD